MEDITNQQYQHERTLKVWGHLLIDVYVIQRYYCDFNYDSISCLFLILCKIHVYTIKYSFHFKEMSKTHKSPSSSLALQQFQHKAFPINNFMSGNRHNMQKISFESRTCKQLVESHFDKVHLKEEKFQWYLTYIVEYLYNYLCIFVLKVCALLLRHKNSKSVHIQLILQVIFPRLAAFKPHEFSRL